MMARARSQECSQVQFGTTEIPYAVKRSLRRRTVSIAIDPTDGVLVTAPVTTSMARLDSVVHAKARWIVQHLRKQPGEGRAGREFVSGETFLYLGRQFRLRVVRADKTRVVLNRGRLVVESADLSPSALKCALLTWYRKRAAERLPERAATWAMKMGIDPPTVLIRDQRQRWGSCDPRGNLRFNWRIVQAPMRLVDYVVAHELVHLKHPNHTTEFWSALEGVLKDGEARRVSLRLLGPRLGW
jgi:predicted metal-dependent hydrolase